LIPAFSALFLLLAGGTGGAAAQTFGPAAPERETGTEAGEARPVTIGLEGPGSDACGAVGRVSGLTPLGEISLPVHERPTSRSGILDRLAPRMLVWLCEAEGEWQGVVFPSGEFQELGDCRVGSPVAAPRAYDGPCRSGWVLGKNLELVAG